jgi:hypothetical protein
VNKTTDSSSQQAPPDAKFITVTEAPKLNFIHTVFKPFGHLPSTTPIFSVLSTAQVHRVATIPRPISDISSSESLCKVTYHTLL